MGRPRLCLVRDCKEKALKESRSIDPTGLCSFHHILRIQEVEDAEIVVQLDDRLKKLEAIRQVAYDIALQAWNKEHGIPTNKR